MTQYKFILDSTELDIAPAGWDKLGITYIRNEFYWSVARSLVLNLRFPLKDGGGGLDILDAYDTDGIEASMTFEIKERNSQTNDYDTIFDGILDFNPERISIDYDNLFFEIGAIDGSKEQKFFTRDELELDINSLVSVDGDTMTDYGFTAEIEFKTINIYLNAYATGSVIDDITLNNGNQQEYLDPSITINSNIIGTRVSDTNPIYTNSTAFDTVVTLDMAGNYDIDYDNHPDIQQASAVMRLMVTVYNSGGTAIYTPTQYCAHTLSESGSPFTGSFDKGDASPYYEWTVPPDGYIEVKLWFSRGWYLSNPDNDIDITFNITQLNIYEQSPGKEDTDVNGYAIHDALVRLIQLTTSEDTPANILLANPLGYLGNTNFVYSILGQYRDLFVVSGWNLRQYPDKPFNVSLRQLFKTIDALAFFGIGYDRINDRFYLDHKTAFFDDSTILFNLGDISGLTRKPAKEHYFNEISFGYNEDVEYEELQGANEFNVPCVHSLKLAVKEKKDLRTLINGDTVGMELARRQPYDEYPQTDTRYDEQIFIVHAGFTVFNDPSIFTYHGVNTTNGFQGSNEYYNTKFTPRENLKRWSKYIGVPLWLSDKETKFVKTQKNIFIEINGESELTGLTASNILGDPLFFPEIYEFKAPFTKEHIDAINANPHGIIQFSSNNIDFAGFILEIQGQGYDNMATYKLLRSPSVDKNYLFEDETLFNFEEITQYEFD